MDRSGGRGGRSLSTRFGEIDISLPGVTPRTLALLALLLAAYVSLLAPLLSSGANDFALAGVYSTDEELAGRIVRRMLAEGTLSPGHFFSYGALYHEVTALLLLPFSAFEVSEREVLVGLRAVSLASGAVTIALTYLLGARLYGGWAGLAAAVLVAISAELAGWSITAHPDTLQLALITGGLIAVCAVRELPSRPRIAAAALLAGLAFGTKYGGVTLLPLILLAAACALGAEGWPVRAVLRRLVVDAALVLAAFLAAFLVTNPYALVEWRRFLTQLRAELEHARTGHVFVEDQSRWRWLRTVASPAVAGPVVLLSAGAAWVLALRQTTPGHTGSSWARVLAVRLGTRALIAVWTVGYLIYLLIFAGYQAPRYALPVLPGLAVSAAGLVTLLTPRLPRAAAAGGLALVVVSAGVAAPRLHDVYDQRADRSASLATDPRVTAGGWLRESVDPAAVIITDAYVYVPGAYTRRTVTFGLTAQQVEAMRPVVIVVNDDVRGRFRDPEAAGRYVDGPEAYAARASAYEQLEAGHLGCYALVRDLGIVRIFADAQALADRSPYGCGAAP